MKKFSNLQNKNSISSFFKCTIFPRDIWKYYTTLEQAHFIPLSCLPNLINSIRTRSSVLEREREKSTNLSHIRSPIIKPCRRRKNFSCTVKHSVPSWCWMKWCIVFSFVCTIMVDLFGWLKFVEADGLTRCACDEEEVLLAETWFLTLVDPKSCTQNYYSNFLLYKSGCLTFSSVADLKVWLVYLATLLANFSKLQYRVIVSVFMGVPDVTPYKSYWVHFTEKSILVLLKI